MNEKILVIVAHPDDEILGCGGLIQKFRKEGFIIKVHCLTSRGLGHEKDEARVRSFIQAMDFLQIPLHSYTELSNADIESMTVADLDADYIRPVIETFAPGMVISHSKLDGNQHHSKVAQAVEIASRDVPILYSFVPPENLPRSPGFRPNVYVTLSAHHVENKCKAFMKYDQDKGANHIRSYEGIKTDAEFHGRIVGARYAEALCAERLVL